MPWLFGWHELARFDISFGSAVGAPVVFFLGAFVYNMVDIQARLGDNDTAHALAFGMCEFKLAPSIR